MILFDYDAKIDQREALQGQMNEVEFWGDQQSAQKTIGEYKVLKAQTEGLE